MNFPFITRNDLKFGRQAIFELELETTGRTAVAVNIVGATKEGIFQFTASSTGSYTTNSNKFRIADLPVFVNVDIEGATQIPRGNTWATLWLSINGERVYKLAAGYLHQLIGLAYPHVQQDSPIRGGGEIVKEIGSNPSAGDEARFTIPTNVYGRLVHVEISLVTDANAGNRRMHLQAGFAGDFMEASSSVDQPASTTRTYHFMPYTGAHETADDDDIFVAIPPDIYVAAADEIDTLTTGLVAGDNIGAIVVTLERYVHEQT